MKISLTRVSGSLLSLQLSQRQAEDVRTVADVKKLLSRLDTSALAYHHTISPRSRRDVRSRSRRASVPRDRGHRDRRDEEPPALVPHPPDESPNRHLSKSRLVESERGVMEEELWNLFTDHGQDIFLLQRTDWSVWFHTDIRKARKMLVSVLLGWQQTGMATQPVDVQVRGCRFLVFSGGYSDISWIYW